MARKIDADGLTEEQRRSLTLLISLFTEKGDQPVYVAELSVAFGGPSKGWGITLSHLSRLSPQLVEVKRKVHERTYEPTEDGMALIGLTGGRYGELQD